MVLICLPLKLTEAKHKFIFFLFAVLLKFLMAYFNMGVVTIHWYTRAKASPENWTEGPFTWVSFVAISQIKKWKGLAFHAPSRIQSLQHSEEAGCWERIVLGFTLDGTNSILLPLAKPRFFNKLVFACWINSVKSLEYVQAYETKGPLPTTDPIMYSQAIKVAWIWLAAWLEIKTTLITQKQLIQFL